MNRFKSPKAIVCMVFLATAAILFSCSFGRIHKLRESLLLGNASGLFVPKGPFHDVTVLSPITGETVGGTVPLRVRVRTRGVVLTTLVVRELEETKTHPSDWVEVYRGAPSKPEVVKFNKKRGLTTAVYSVEWNTTRAHDGQHLIRIGAAYTVRNEGRSAGDIAERHARVLNLGVTSCSPEIVLWRGDVGSLVPIAVNLQDNDLCHKPVNLSLKLYPTDPEDRSSDTPARTLTANVINEVYRPHALSYTFKWNGKNESGEYVNPGMYTYEVAASQEPDSDSASYRSGRWLGRNYRPYLTIDSQRGISAYQPLEVEFDGERDNGTPADKADDFYEYYIRYTLIDKQGADAASGELLLYSPELRWICSWSIGNLPCRNHDGKRDGLGAMERGMQHEVLVRVPKKLMPPEGIYKFVLNMQDRHGVDYRDHQRRYAFSLSVRAPRYKIEFARRGDLYIVWCRAEAIDEITKRVIDVGWEDIPNKTRRHGMAGAAKCWVRDEPHKVLLVKRAFAETKPEIFGTGPGEIRAAVNGGLVALPMFEPVGDIGADFGWGYFEPSPRSGLWAFSMASVGGEFTSQEVEQSPVHSHIAGKTVEGFWCAPDSVRQAHAYGRGAVGLLVKDNVPQDHPSWWPPIIPKTKVSVDIPLKRTAIAFSEDVGGGKRHFFLITTPSGTWDGMARFIYSPDGLARSLQPLMGKYNGVYKPLRIERAFMMDGGTSSQLAYRVKDTGGSIVKRAWSWPSEYDFIMPSDDRTITDIVAVRATCKDVGNRPIQEKR